MPVTSVRNQQPKMSEYSPHRTGSSSQHNLNFHGAHHLGAHERSEDSSSSFSSSGSIFIGRRRRRPAAAMYDLERRPLLDEEKENHDPYWRQRSPIQDQFDARELQVRQHEQELKRLQQEQRWQEQKIKRKEAEQKLHDEYVAKLSV